MVGRGPQKNILLVEDEPTLQRILGSVLGDAGHRVEAVGTAEQALDRLDDGDIDLVLTDKNLPRKSGLDLLAAIRAQEREGKRLIGVVMVTGYPSRDSALQALSDDADGYLVKPFRSLTHAVEQVDLVLRSDLVRRRAATPLARRLAAVLGGLPDDVAGVRVTILGDDVLKGGASAVLAAAGAVVSTDADGLAVADAVVAANVEDVVAACAARPGIAAVLADAGATFQDVVAFIGAGGGAIVDVGLIAPAVPPVGGLT
jgi:CheY-like chemotaxis protein